MQPKNVWHAKTKEIRKIKKSPGLEGQRILLPDLDERQLGARLPDHVHELRARAGRGPAAAAAAAAGGYAAAVGAAAVAAGAAAGAASRYAGICAGVGGATVTGR